METKEWPLRPEDIRIPVPEIPPPKYVMTVEIVGGEKLWPPEQGFIPSLRPARNVPETVLKGSSKGAPKTPETPQQPSPEPKSDLVASDGEVQKLFSKVSVSFRFPGESVPEVPVVSDPIAALPQPPPPPPAPVLTQDQEDELSDNELPPPPPPPIPPVTRFGCIARKDFEVHSNYTLWNRLLQEPLEVTVYWTSPSGLVTKPLGRALINLFPALALRGGRDVLEIEGKIEKIPEPPVVEEKLGKGKKVKKEKPKEKETVEKLEKVEKKSKKKKDAPDEPIIEDTLPDLPQDAVLNIKVFTSVPFWSESNRIHGLVMEININAIVNLPPKLQEFARRGDSAAEKGDKREKTDKVDKNNKGSKGEKGDPFSYLLAAYIPGFVGTSWWNMIEGLTPEDRASLECMRFEGGKVVNELVPPAITPSESEEEFLFAPGSEEAVQYEKIKAHKDVIQEMMDDQYKQWEDEAVKRRETAKKVSDLQNRLLCCEQSMKIDEEEDFFREPDPEPAVTSPEPTERMVIRWFEGSMPTVKRFIPGDAALELLDLVKSGRRFRGELARYMRSQPDVYDSSFEKYRGCFFFDLSEFLEEGVQSVDVQIPFKQFTYAGTYNGLYLCEAPPKPTGKKTPKVVEDDDPLPVSLDPCNILPNTAWQISNAMLVANIRTSKPMMPIWEPPPQPDLTLEEVIPPRKKQQTVYNAVKLALQKFNEFVEVAAEDLIDMYDKLTNVDNKKPEKDIVDSTSAISKRIESKGEIRKKMVKMLRKSGTWNDLVEEMKVRVLKVAAEKFREKRRGALDIGKFEFCNDLYITLAEVIYNTLKDSMKKRRALKELEPIKDVDHLRGLADEYEVSEDWTNAYRCHQERLKGEDMKNADLWFEVRPKDHGKAEECWREALTLDKSHLLSLQALGSLMWHRGYLTQAEVLLRSAVDIHSLEEHISWVLVSQVYAAQGKLDNERACLRRAEQIYRSSISSGYRSHYSPPHQLLSRLLQNPFSLAYQSLDTKKASSTFIEAILFLLDIHLPVEAQTILKLDTDIYSCTLDNKWCRMRAAELTGDLEGLETFTKEALAIDKEHYMTWLLSGHARYAIKSNNDLPQTLQNWLWKGCIDAYSKYHRYYGIEKHMYEHAYLEMGMAHFKLSEFDQARKIFLKGCTVKPTSPSLWLAAGIAYYFLGDIKHAELALVEGNVLDVQNFQIWAYLTLVCLQLGRDEEAENAFQQALKTNLDPKLLACIADNFCLAGNFRDAETAFTESLKLQENAGVRFNRAEMYFKTGRFQPAKEEYNKVVKLSDVEASTHSTAISRLTELQDLADPIPGNRFPENPNYEV